ncbi:hypothetical protein [Paenibacillus larvae]|uniref:hypothetical protein n=1 Tax=Paenibacillus larvae TaxID=1464 RepID=UPI00288F04BA|nr:hypothetical protein [Paenibacillus larvae]MDT2191431.1 hypothetical protein [Paenibacillus larvae]MDT2242714.1 hypothetical protein [Paenibacillus larvae]MDT2275839.1 hypothetical protein [Paenibacillus larvae]MDT2291902.1 hypothetical protein [Paenibacillus larvae]MDT2304810.1 hypothetical protein [Paenibacillus larvae]
MAIDDKGEPFKVSPDPLMDVLQGHLRNINIEDNSDIHNVRSSLKPILSNHEIFGMNLYEIGLGERIETYFQDMIQKTELLEILCIRLLKKKETCQYGNDVQMVWSGE